MTVRSVIRVKQRRLRLLQKTAAGAILLKPKRQNIYRRCPDMSQVLVNFRMDEEDKKGMEEVCKELGLSMTTAFTLRAKNRLSGQ